jgi:hypothetical protein
MGFDDLIDHRVKKIVREMGAHRAQPLFNLPLQHRASCFLVVFLLRIASHR